MKYRVSLAPLALTLFLLAGCAAAPADSSASADRSAAGSAASSSADERLAALSAGEYAPLRAFVDENISAVPQATADQMVRALMAASEAFLPGASETFNNTAGASEAIAAACAADPSVSASVIAAGDRDRLTARMKDDALRELLEGDFSRGLCLVTAEGMYYLAVDYCEYAETYGAYVGSEVKDCLSILSAETKAPTTREEYLAVSPGELGRRAAACETFLKRYPDSAYAGTVQNLLLTAVWKLACPSPTDGLTDEGGRVTEEMTAVYRTLAADSERPVLRRLAQEMQDYIAAQPGGVVCENYDLSALTAHAETLNAQAQAQLAELYG